MTKPDEAPRLKEWASASEISEILGVSRQTVNKMIHAGEFETLHVSGATSASKPLFLVSRKEVDHIKENRVFTRAGIPEMTAEPEDEDE
jgi:excisionase family DNA binding protein